MSAILLPTPMTGSIRWHKTTILTPRSAKLFMAVSALRFPPTKLAKKLPNASQAETSCHVSVLTIGELTRGIYRLPVTAKRAKLERWMQTEFLQRFKNRMIPIDEAVAMRWGVLVAEAVLPTIDSLLAATAQEHRLTLVTRNTKDFLDIGVKMLNPWDCPN